MTQAEMAQIRHLKIIVTALLMGAGTFLAAAAIAEAPDDAGRFNAVQRYATATVIGGVLAEGTTLFAGVGALLTGHMGLLALGSLGLVAIVRLFPSQGKFERFVGRGEKGVTTPR